MGFGRKEEGLMRNRKQTTFRNEQAPKWQENPQHLRKRSPTQLSNIGLTPATKLRHHSDTTSHVLSFSKYPTRVFSGSATNYCPCTLCQIPDHLRNNSVTLVNSHFQLIDKKAKTEQIKEIAYCHRETGWSGIETKPCCLQSLCHFHYATSLVAG